MMVTSSVAHMVSRMIWEASRPEQDVLTRVRSACASRTSASQYGCTITTYGSSAFCKKSNQTHFDDQDWGDRGFHHSPVTCHKKVLTRSRD